MHFKQYLFLILFTAFFIAPVEQSLVGEVLSDVQFHIMKRKYPEAFFIVVANGRMWPTNNIELNPDKRITTTTFIDLIDNKTVIISGEFRIIEL